MEITLDQIMAYNEAVLTLDAAESAFFKRELEHIIPELFEFEHAKINARRVFPIDRSAGPAAETILFRQITKSGLAKVISDYANDIPLVNIEVEEFSGNVRSLAIAALWSIQEIRAAVKAGRPLDREQSDAARETILRLENQIAFQGDATNGLVGLFTDPNIPRTAAAGVWSAAAPAAILADLNLAANAIPETTGDVEEPQTLLVPTAQFNIIAEENAALGTDTTIMRYFLNNNPYISEIMRVRELAGAGTGGVDVIVAMDRNPRKIRMHVPLDLEQLAPQEKDLGVKTIYHTRAGGVQVIKPLSLHIVEGV